MESYCVKCKRKTGCVDSSEKVGECKGRSRIFRQSTCSECGKKKSSLGGTITEVKPEIQVEGHVEIEKPKRKQKLTREEVNFNNILKGIQDMLVRTGQISKPSERRRKATKKESSDEEQTHTQEASQSS